MGNMADIIYTTVDEAPELASASLLPIIRKFVSAAGLQIEKRDISLAGRIIALFPEILTDAQRHGDDLAALGDLVKTPQANVIKLPNISASVPQLKAAISELQAQGYALPDYPDTPQNDTEQSARDRYDAVKGSAVNPVLREGNSDRRTARAIKNYAMQNPHKMGVWQKESATHVVSMPTDDFVSNELSATVSDDQAGSFKIVFENQSGQQTVLKDGLDITAGTVVDAAFMNVVALRRFIAEQLADAKAKNILFSVHLKATMMKVADPIIFGHVVSVLLQDFITNHASVLDSIGFNPNLGLSDLEQRLAGLPAKQRSQLERDLAATLADQPRLYMVDSDRGISNLHVSSDVIIDASMPALIRAGGRAWGPDGQEADCKCVIPDNSYAPIYDESIDFFKANGALDPTSCGTVSNVGLMAQKAEEYGSHPTTFEMAEAGIVRVMAANGDVVHEHHVGAGAVWRAMDEPRCRACDRAGCARQLFHGGAGGGGGEPLYRALYGQRVGLRSHPTGICGAGRLRCARRGDGDTDGCHQHERHRAPLAAQAWRMDGNPETGDGLPAVPHSGLAALGCRQTERRRHDGGGRGWPRDARPRTHINPRRCDCPRRWPDLHGLSRRAGWRAR